MMTCRCGAIDVHTHIVPEDFPRYARGAAAPAGWPSMARADEPCHRHVMVSGKIYRTVSDRTWNAGARIGDMDALSVGRQVLSPMPELLSYWLDAGDAQALLRYLNEQIAAMVAHAPSRFFGLGAVPLQDVPMAVAELEYIVRGLGLSGVEIGGSVNGQAIGAPEFEPFWAAAEELGAAVFIHPLRPAGADRLVGPRVLEQVVAFPSETGLALASLMTGGVMDRHPRLRIAASHGGGAFIALLSRLQHGWRTFPDLRKAMPSAPNELARRLYVDSLVYDAGAVRRLIEQFGERQVLVGSDYPFAIQETDPVGAIERLELPEATRSLLLWENALRWLGVDADAA